MAAHRDRWVAFVVMVLVVTACDSTSELVAQGRPVQHVCRYLSPSEASAAVDSPVWHQDELIPGQNRNGVQCPYSSVPPDGDALPSTAALSRAAYLNVSAVQGVTAHALDLPAEGTPLDADAVRRYPMIAFPDVSYTAPTVIHAGEVTGAPAVWYTSQVRGHPDSRMVNVMTFPSGYSVVAIVAGTDHDLESAKRAAATVGSNLPKT
jgi:hypothetical protein